MMKPSRRHNLTLLTGALIFSTLLLAALAIESFNQQDVIATSKRCVAAGQPQQAVDLLTQILARNPRHGRALLHRGLAYAALGQLERAREDLTAAIDCGADKATALAARASVALRAQQYDEAIADGTSALFYNPQCLEALEVRAVAKARRSDFSGCIADSSSALALSSDPTVRARLLRERGAALAQEHEAGTALSDLNSAIATSVTEPLLLQRAAIYRRQKRLAEAIADCSAALKLNPWSARALVLRGKCYAAQHHRAQAIRDFTTAQMVDGNCVEALIQRGCVYLESGDRSASEADFRRAVELNPYVTEAVMRLRRITRQS